MNKLATFAVVLVSLLYPRPTLADPFRVLPSGDLVFDTTVRAGGTFQCVIVCEGEGTNSVTFGSDGSLTFTGFEVSAPLAGIYLTPLILGQFLLTGPEGFVVPDSGHPQVAPFRFTLTLNQTAPVASTRSLSWTLKPGVQGDLRVFEATSNYILMPLPPIPPEFRYTAMAYSFDLGGLRIPLNDPTDLIAQAGAIPEPGTLLLLSTGVVAAAVRRHRQLRRSLGRPR